MLNLFFWGQLVLAVRPGLVMGAVARPEAVMLQFACANINCCESRQHGSRS